MNINYLILITLLSPVFLTYVVIGFLSPLLIFGKRIKGSGYKIFLVRDLIHCDYIFESEQVKDLFPSNYRFVKIGWGDRKIFLETKSWSELKFIDFIKAFFGLNSTVLRVEYLNKLPYPNKSIEMDMKQMNLLIDHIKKSFYGNPIKKEPNYYSEGDYYKSNLKYNCFTNCNNWVNRGLYLSKVTNRIWCPFSFML